MPICDYKELVNKWKDILMKVEAAKGKTRELIIGPPATKEEIEEKEKALGFSLPKAFKEVLLNFSKHVELNWYLPKEANLPQEFREIFSGELGWNLEWVEDLNALAGELEYCFGEEVESNLRNKLQFFQTGNGDLLAFDRLQKDGESIVYWSHEGDEITYIADQFLSYIHSITDLYCVGSELWQLEPFLKEEGLDVSSDVAAYWKEWFESFTMISLEQASQHIESLIEYVEAHGEIGKAECDAFNKFDKDIIFQKVIYKLENGKCNATMLNQILGEVLGTHIAPWVQALWSGESKVDPLMRTYLTAKCLTKEEALQFVLPYVENMMAGGSKVYEAVNHLSCLRSSTIIHWMKEQVPNTQNNGEWATLFARSEPSWRDIIEWFALGGKYKKIALSTLERMVDSWGSSYISGNLKLEDKPSKEKIISDLEEIKLTEILKTKREVYDKIIENIDLIL